MTAVDDLTPDQIRALRNLAVHQDAKDDLGGGADHAREDLRARLACTNPGTVLREWIGRGPGWGYNEAHIRGYEALQDRAERVLKGHPTEIRALLGDNPDDSEPSTDATARTDEIRADHALWLNQRLAVSGLVRNEADDATLAVAENIMTRLADKTLAHLPALLDLADARAARIAELEQRHTAARAICHELRAAYPGIAPSLDRIEHALDRQTPAETPRKDTP